MKDKFEEQEFRDEIGDLLKQSESKELKGKPLPKEYLKKDVFQNFQSAARDAGFLPPWLKLQKEISALVHAYQSEQDLEEINEKIRKHNTICPTQFQKNLISMDTLKLAKERW